MEIIKKFFTRCGHCLKFFFMPTHGLLWQIMMTISEDFGFSRSAAIRACVDKDGSPIPWYTYTAIEFLSQFCYKDLSVFEYGSGNSTLYWSARAAQVTSVEHNPQWYSQMQRVYADRGNVACILQPDSERYVSCLSQKYDIIVIDSNWRDACSACALQYIKEGGMSGTEFIVEDGVCKLKDRSAFAGSVATANVLIRTMVNEAGCSVPAAVKMLTKVPAEILKVNKGELAPGKDADIVVFDEDIAIKQVFLAGKRV